MSEPTTTSSSTPPAVGVTVRVPGPLRPLAGGSDELSVTAATVGGSIDDLLARCPGLQRHLRTEAGSLREHVNIFLNEDDIRYLDGEATGLTDGDVVTIVPSIAGG